MDLTTKYCATRRDLEERGWFLTTRLANLTARLMRAIGQNHEMFLNLRTECRATRRQIVTSHQDLRKHRLEHGC